MLPHRIPAMGQNQENVLSQPLRHQLSARSVQRRTWQGSTTAVFHECHDSRQSSMRNYIHSSRKTMERSISIGTESESFVLPVMKYLPECDFPWYWSIRFECHDSDKWHDSWHRWISSGQWSLSLLPNEESLRDYLDSNSWKRRNRTEEFRMRIVRMKMKSDSLSSIKEIQLL